MVLNTSQFFTYNTFFTEQKRNIIIDGLFTKMIYSNETLSMNGIYFIFPIEQYMIEKNQYKMYLKFSPYHPSNYSIIQQFIKIEKGILEYYKETTNYKNNINILLSKQLLSGNVKIYNEKWDNSINAEKTKHFTSTLNKNQYFVIKMSGIWETDNEIGTTFKLFVMNGATSSPL